MTQLASDIKQTINQLAKLEAVDRHYQSLVDQKAEMENTLNSIEIQLAKELEDVQKLEKMGITSMFYKVLGSKEQQLEKERQEYLELSLKHTESVKSLKVLKYEQELIEGKVRNIQGLQEKLERLKEARYQEILTQPSALRDQLVALNKRRDAIQHEMQLLKETENKGQAAYQSLHRVVQYFGKAKEWGNWDMGSGRGRYYGRQKHNAISSAVSEANRANLLLNSFSADLRAVGFNAGKMSVGFKSFSGFMDVMFDNLISDWIVQNKIKNALSNTAAVKDRVSSIISTLQKEGQQLAAQLEEIERQVDRLLES